MIPCARLYVDPTLALMSQAMEKRIPGLLKQQLENTRGQNSLFIMDNQNCHILTVILLKITVNM